jgi:cobalt-zinc-cadmium efflux system membrane fusion protein
MAGQPLAVLRADVERSRSRRPGPAQGLGELRAAEANAELARQKLARAQDLANQQFISSQALEQARAEALVAENRLIQAREQRDGTGPRTRAGAAQLGLRTIRSPSTGVIVDRYLSPGERVEEKPIFRVAMIDPLRVEVVLPASFYASVVLGMPPSPSRPSSRARRRASAKVTLVDKVIDGASNTFRVRLELPNPDFALPAGVRCKADLGGPLPAKAPSRPPAPARADPALRLQMAPLLVISPAPKL